ncbi:thioredoxin domain-containing protein 16 isoform X2 [Oncorhynchus tshawytscha]|uniref:thioredoxin domain-containing protein 16 isoform X2 n=1 Tax=Oncorhynchus tshawytscha TaxID=74940 RepID=UPI001C3CE892|nr:thioredoxin domain-containing protein 16 isoform X2 [Oncorhynchus tshawytscha]
MAWFICVVILLLCSKSEQCTTGNASKLIEHTAAHFFEKMQSGKMYFIYFGKQVNPTIGLFIEQLEKSADVLEDYGISVAKVNCTNEHIAKYCTGEKLMKKVYLFRGGNVLKSFDTDTVFDVNAIVSHVLLVEDISSLTAGLWFLHCKGASQHSDSCPHTALRRALTTLHIYTFLQLMEAPLVSEASVEPSEVNMVHSHLQVPLLFLFSQPHTVALDRVTAQTLAWRLRGQVGLVLIHRESPDVKIPLEYNAAYRLPGEGSEVKYLILNNLEEVIDLFRDESTPEEEDDDDNWATLDVLDDEVAESVYRDRAQSLDMDAVTELTADTFHNAVAESDYTVVLFYVKWDAVSMAFMQSYIEVSESLEDADVSDVELAVLDCGEWTDVCSAQKIRSFPTVRLYRPQEPSQPYQGMLGTESLNRFIMLSRLVSPVLLSSPDEVTSFLEGDMYQRHAAIAPVTVLGLFSSTADAGVPVFKEAAKALRGETMVGLFADRQAEIWAVEYSVTLPAILVSRGPTGQTEAHSLNLSMPDQLVTHIQRALLDTFPELTVENLPLYLEVKKKLLLLFVGEEESGRKGNKRVLDDMRSLLNTGLLNPYLPCWIHLGRTPAGKAVLEAYLGFLPLLPALVVSQLATGGEVFHYPTGRPLMVQPILQWLQRVEDGEEPPAGVIVDEKWMPSMPFYDFLSVMDQEVPGYASQRSAKTKTNRIERAEGEKEKSSSGGGERQARTGAHDPQGSPTTKPPQTSHHHSEL